MATTKENVNELGNRQEAPHIAIYKYVVETNVTKKRPRAVSPLAYKEFYGD